MLSYLQYCRVESHPVTIPTPTHVTVLCRVRFLPVASSRGWMTLSMDGGGDKGNGRICGVGIGIVVAGQGLYCCANGCSGYVLKDGGGQDYNFRNRIGSSATTTNRTITIHQHNNGAALSASFCRCPLSETYYCLFAVYILLFISQFDYRLCVCAMSPFRPSLWLRHRSLLDMIICGVCVYSARYM